MAERKDIDKDLHRDDETLGFLKQRFKFWLIEYWRQEGSSEEARKIARDQVLHHNQTLLADRLKWDAEVQEFENSVPEEYRHLFGIYFNGSVFRTTNFSELSFPISVSFRGCKFLGRSDFKNCSFSGESVSFYGAGFGVGSKFENAIFCCEKLNFKGCTFDFEADFKETFFKCKEINFSNISFKGGCNFSGSKFKADSISFEKTNFNNGCSFNSVHFNGTEISFKKSNFQCGDVSFGDALFRGDVLFEGSEFENMVDFSCSSGCQAVPFLSMRACKFDKIINLSGREFERPPDFVASHMMIPPDLSDVKIAGPKLVERSVFKVGKFKVAKDKADAARYRKLKGIAISNNDYAKELEFFAYEMKARRWHQDSHWANCISLVYEWLSDFGQSFGLPLTTLFCVFLIFLPLYYCRAGMPYDEALAFGFHMSVPFLAPFLESPGSLTGWQKGLGILNVVFSLPLWFLFSLGLRNKFKIK